ncbi:MAG: DUF1402 family protein [Bdellovibrionaceae bacterium]|nr:DUF1402 family protein [Pseudobdellovibrionaceae bacterium]
MIFSHFNRTVIALSIGCLLGSPALAQNPFLGGAPYRACSDRDVQRLPPGNQNANIPSLPRNSKLRLLAFEQISVPNEPDANATKEILAFGARRVPEILRELQHLGLISEIKQVGRAYNIDPALVLAPIVVEMSFNGFLDRALQDKLSSVKGAQLAAKSTQLQELTKDPEVRACMSASISNYWKWKCVDYFMSAYDGAYLRSSLSGIGTYGIAQFNPVLVWSLNDVVAKTSGYKKIQFGDFASSLQTVLDPKATIHYIAAYLQTAMQIYRDVSCFDVSGNLGVTATLYNLGNEYQRAFYAAERFRQERTTPQENYFGWYANAFEKEIRAAVR